MAQPGQAFPQVVGMIVANGRCHVRRESRERAGQAACAGVQELSSTRRCVSAFHSAAQNWIGSTVGAASVPWAVHARSGHRKARRRSRNWSGSEDSNLHSGRDRRRVALHSTCVTRRPAGRVPALLTGWSDDEWVRLWRQEIESRQWERNFGSVIGPALSSVHWRKLIPRSDHAPFVIRPRHGVKGKFHEGVIRSG